MNLLIPKEEKKSKWTREACYEVARTCHTISEMECKSSKAAKHARDNGWVADYTWFKNPEDDTSQYHYCVYLYTDGIAAYVGLTRDYRLRLRDYEHRNKKHGKSDSLKTYFDNKNEKIPEPIILENGLTATEAQYYEDFYKKKYENDGYLILNRAKTGVGYGAVGVSYASYTYDMCKEIAM